MTATKGLEGVVAAQSTISSIIDDQLTYVGYTIDDLAENASFEEVIFLLWKKRLPNKQELQELKQNLFEHMALPNEIIEHFKSYDIHSVHPMTALRTAVSFLGLVDPEADDMSEEANERKAIRLQARVSSVVAAFSRIRDGKEVIKPKEGLGYAANFLYMLNGKEPEDLERSEEHTSELQSREN